MISTNSLALKNISISIINVTNPSDNRIMKFKVFQHEYELTPQLIYGYREFDVSVIGLPAINVYSGVRNATKMGANIEL